MSSLTWDKTAFLIKPFIKLNLRLQNLKLYFQTKEFNCLVKCDLWSDANFAEHQTNLYETKANKACYVRDHNEIKPVTSVNVKLPAEFV